MGIQTKRKVVEIVDLISLPCAFLGIFELLLQHCNPNLSLNFEIYTMVGIIISCFLILYFWGKYEIQGILMDFGFSLKEAESFQARTKNYDMWQIIHDIQKEKMDKIMAKKYIQEKLAL